MYLQSLRITCSCKDLHDIVRVFGGGTSVEYIVCILESQAVEVVLEEVEIKL